MPTKASREDKLAKRAARKVTNKERKSHQKKVKTFLDDDQKEVIEPVLEKMSGDVFDRPNVIKNVLNFPDGTNVSDKVKDYMKKSHVKPHVVHEVFELFKGYENARVKHIKHTTYKTKTKITA